MVSATQKLIRWLSGFSDIRNIFIYISKDDEPDTSDMINYLFKNHYNVIVPRCAKGFSLLPVRIMSIKELKKGRYGIMEPVSDTIFPKEKIDLYIVPGTEFDIAGNRKGRGKGYFDRFLADVKGKKTIIGLSKRSGFFKKIRTRAWDVPVDIVFVDD